MTRAEFETNLLLLKFHNIVDQYTLADNKLRYRYTDGILIFVSGYIGANIHVSNKYQGSFNFELALEKIVTLLEKSRDKRRVNN